ncbi:hypothetical protein S7711_11481 [Stachybotrys chartarum IBT 7711]|uniref:Uncharacterized protein n=1 Tax=Stachybotrys chartarum (strain CBS 109288 / IBT 7711) TaxID=1280523 RepID=A0A084AU53_STACB|nr:hypothetical protein S7711_11481 [Stachybotrys chartarum IBT 7711]
MEDPAGACGVRRVPKAVMIVEFQVILQACKWQVASLNEFLDFLGLKGHESFTDINKNHNIAKIFEQLDIDSDMVVLYPGLMIEDIKPTHSPRSGLCPIYTVGRAVLADANTLVHSDRFYTLDYNVVSLTNWGYDEVYCHGDVGGGWPACENNPLDTTNRQDMISWQRFKSIFTA